MSAPWASASTSPTGARAEADLQLYRAFVDAAPQFIALANSTGRSLHVNPGGRRLAGIPDDVDVTTTTIADYLTAEGLAASVEVEQPAVIRDGRYEGETTLRHWPTGDGIPVRVVVVPRHRPGDRRPDGAGHRAVGPA